MATFENAGRCGGAGHYYVGWRGTAKDEVTHRYGIWDLKTYRLEAEFDTRADGSCIVSGNGRWMALKGKDAQSDYLELRALPSGKVAGVYRAAGFVFDWVFFSPDGQYLFVGDLNQQSYMAILDLPEMNVRWKYPTGPMRGIHFSPDSNIVQFFMVDDPAELRCLDCASGKLRATVTMPKFDGFIEDPMHISRDGRMISVRRVGEPKSIWPAWVQRIPWFNWTAETQTDTIVLVDAESCRERFRLHTGAIVSFFLSDDGRTVATAHATSGGGRIICCWDVDARKPLHWAVGVPIALAGLVTLVGWWFRRRAPATTSLTGAESSTN